MKWIAGGLALGMLVIIAAPGVSDAGPERASKSTRKDSPAATDDTTPPANVTDPEAYQKELDAAKEQRDRDLKEAAKETDRKRFEKRKEEIFARYASILAAMRDKYEAHLAEDGDPQQGQAQRPGKSTRTGTAKLGSTDRSASAERPGRPEARKKSVRRDDDDAIADADPAPKGNAKSKRPSRSRGDDTGGTLADAQQRLVDENTRHDTAMVQLNKDLSDAQASKNKREVRIAERAIDKENTTYEAKRTLLEGRVKELGGTIAKPPSEAPRGAAPTVR